MNNESWRSVGVEFERYPKINAELKKKGDVKIVTFLDDGKKIGADILAAAMKEKGIKIKARDSVLFIVDDNGQKKELWIGATSFTSLRELNKIAPNLTGVRVKITRIAEKDPEQANFKFERV